MTDIFLKQDLVNLLKDKNVVFMGDSFIRALYKDLLCLSESSSLVPLPILRKKVINSVFDDKLVSSGPITNGRNFREEREKTNGAFKVSFYFLTRVYNEYVKEKLKHITSKDEKPDVVIINSCLWDITRWGPNGVDEYKINLVKLMEDFQKFLPEHCLVIWLTTSPIAVEMKGGFLVTELQFLKYSCRFHVVESNHYARKVVVAHGYDILDLHYHLKMQLNRRDDDGLHWLPVAVRFQLNLILTHISLAWGVPLPHRFDSMLLEKSFELDDIANKSETVLDEDVQEISIVKKVQQACENKVKHPHIRPIRAPSPKKQKNTKINSVVPVPDQVPISKKEKEISVPSSKKTKKKKAKKGSVHAFMRQVREEKKRERKTVCTPPMRSYSPQAFSLYSQVFSPYQVYSPRIAEMRYHRAMLQCLSSYESGPYLYAPTTPLIQNPPPYTAYPFQAYAVNGQFQPNICFSSRDSPFYQ